MAAAQARRSRMSPKPQRRIPWDAIGLTVSLVVFGLTCHQARWWPLSCSALLVAGVLFAVCGVAHPHAAHLFGFSPRPRFFWLKLLVAVAFGLSLAALYRFDAGFTTLPRSCSSFVFAAALIGACEELTYRGYLYGRVRPWGIFQAVCVAAAAHTLYKASLGVFPPSGPRLNLAFPTVVTFLGGAAFGLMREYLGSTLFPLAAHAAFDVLTYCDWTGAPWWVWG